MTETAVLGRPAAPVLPVAPRALGRLAAPVSALLLFIALGLFMVGTTEFPGNDELEHVSYAAHLQETGRLLPEFERQRTLRRDDFSLWDDRPNYIGHPSPFYALIARTLDRSLPAAQAVLTPRLASLGLLAAGVALAVFAGARAFRRDGGAVAVVCASVALCPGLSSIAGMVTNDSLAVLGGALAYWGLAAPARGRLHAAAAGAGLMLALWAKPNAGLAVGAMVAAMIVLARPGRFRLLGAACVGGLLGLVPMAPIVLGYGAVVPVTAEGVWAVASIASPVEYLPAFLLNLGNTFGFLRTGAWPLPQHSAPALVVAFWAMLGCIAWGARAEQRSGRPPVALAGMVAFAAVLPIHFWFSAHKLGGSLPAASFRYDLPLWPALAHGLAAAVAFAPGRWRAGAACVGAAAFALAWLPV